MKNRLPSVRLRLRAKGEQAAIVVLVAALHGLVLYQVATGPTTQMQLTPAPPAVIVELAFAPSAAETTLRTPAPESPPQPATESAPQQDTLAAVKQEILPPKPVEQRGVKTPPPRKPVRKALDTSALDVGAKTAEAASAAPSTSRSPSLPTAGATTPASATAAHLNNPAPQYPPLALKRKWQGTVHLRVQVLASGRPGEIQIVNSSGRDLLDQAAVAAVHQWSFVAAQQGGVAVESWATFPLSFKLH